VSDALTPVKDTTTRVFLPRNSVYPVKIGEIQAKLAQTRQSPELRAFHVGDDILLAEGSHRACACKEFGIAYSTALYRDDVRSTRSSASWPSAPRGVGRSWLNGRTFVPRSWSRITRHGWRVASEDELSLDDLLADPIVRALMAA